LPFSKLIVTKKTLAIIGYLIYHNNSLTKLSNVLFTYDNSHKSYSHYKKKKIIKGVYIFYIPLMVTNGFTNFPFGYVSYKLCDVCALGKKIPISKSKEEELYTHLTFHITHLMTKSKI